MKDRDYLAKRRRDKLFEKPKKTEKPDFDNDYTPVRKDEKTIILKPKKK